MTLREMFESDFATSAFRIADGETRIVGRFAEVALNDDGTLDIWIVAQDREPIGTRKLRNIIRAIGASRKPTIHELTLSRLRRQAEVNLHGG
ncbi:MAG TPA: hypothetical protein VK971_00480 [Thiohalobacter sp.]|nr:hypothetical protein [Thiohalobacter sp.]